ncbi:MAG: hypothetical protein GY757_32925, partial [bacterium]|nr:hypothetical protein [bacterium]
MGYAPRQSLQAKKAGTEPAVKTAAAKRSHQPAPPVHTYTDTSWEPGTAAGTGTAAEVLQLQQTAGNRAVTGMIQTGSIRSLQEGTSYKNPPAEVLQLEREVAGNANMPETAEPRPEEPVQEPQPAENISAESPQTPPASPPIAQAAGTGSPGSAPGAAEAPPGKTGEQLAQQPQEAEKEEQLAAKEKTAAPLAVTGGAGYTGGTGEQGGAAAGAPQPASADQAAPPGEDTAKPGGIAQVTGAFFKASASKIASTMGSLGTAITKAFTVDRRKIQETTPPVTAGMDGSAIPQAARPAPPPSLPEPVQTPYRPPETGIQRRDTPRFRPTGEADPARADRQAGQAAAEVRSRHGQFANQITAAPGGERIQPIVTTESAQIEVPDTKLKVKTKVPPEAAEYLQTPGNVRQAASKETAEILKPHLDPEKAKIDKALENSKKQKEEAVNKTKADADTLTQKAKQDQKNEIEKARGEINLKKKETQQEAAGMVKGHEEKVAAEKQKTLD